MAGEDIERRLAAIMSADVAGYSRLMGTDEAGTLSALKALRRDVFAPQVAAHKGRVVKLMGDGALVEFPSIVNAVDCAIAVQRALAEQTIQLRIGINLGDIIVEGSDIYGDGVNIAARLEGLAEPGGICVARNVYDQVKSKVEASFEDLGEKEVKNIPEPLRVYRVATERLSSAVTSPTTKPLPLPDKPSVAVLPFTNMSGDSEQEYFSDGITEDIITELSRFHSLFVIARNSSFTYKGKAVDVTEVGSTLGVQYVVEGSVRKAGNRVRVTAQLVEAQSGRHVWARRYDRDLSDSFELQDEISKVIVGTIAGRVDAAEAQRVAWKPPGDMTAYDRFLRGLQEFNRQERVPLANARELFQDAIDLDSSYARAYAHLAFTHVCDVWYGYTDRE